MLCKEKGNPEYLGPQRVWTSSDKGDLVNIWTVCERQTLNYVEMERDAIHPSFETGWNSLFPVLIKEKFNGSPFFTDLLDFTVVSWMYYTYLWLFHACIISGSTLYLSDRSSRKSYRPLAGGGHISWFSIWLNKGFTYSIRDC